jgi:hypothetical protein
METQPAKQKKNIFQNDRLVVFGMLAIYGFCVLGCIAAVWGGSAWRSHTISVRATSTAVAVSTQAAKQEQYELVDHFDSNQNRWETGEWTGLEWDGSQQIKSGVMVWDIDPVYDFAKVEMEIVPINDFINDYDTYVDTKLSLVPSGTACSGLMFRRSQFGWDNGGYSFMVCDSGYLVLYYHNREDGWQEINSQYHPAIHKDDWNRLEVKVDGFHFIFLINNQIVFETDDERQPNGGVALMASVEASGTQILFDNFGYQHH